MFRLFHTIRHKTNRSIKYKPQLKVGNNGGDTVKVINGVLAIVGTSVCVYLGLTTFLEIVFPQYDYRREEAEYEHWCDLNEITIIEEKQNPGDDS